MLEIRWFTLEIQAFLSLLLTTIPEIKLLVTPVDLHFKAICFMNKTTCPLNNVKKKTHKFYDMTNFISVKILF